MTESPAAILADLRSSGFTLATDGDRLRVSPRDRLAPEQCEAIRQAKFELLYLLACERLRSCSRCAAWVDPLAGADVRTCCPYRSTCPQRG